MSKRYFPLAHTVVAPPGTLIHEAHPERTLEFTVHFFPATSSGTQPAGNMKAYAAIGAPPGARKYLNRTELEAFTGASEADIAEATNYFEQFSIKKTEENRLTRIARYRGRIEDINKAFHTRIGVYQGAAQQSFTGYSDALYLPGHLHTVVQHISGINPQPKLEHRVPHFSRASAAEAEAQPESGYTTQQLVEAYNFPSGLTGAGQCMGIVELGGHYLPADIEQYFNDMKLPQPVIETVGQPVVDTNMLNNSEVTLDIQVAATAAPGAKIVIYYAHTILEAMQLVLQDESNAPGIVSISWAGSEQNYSPFQVSELTQVFYEAALLGITVVAASGDHGAFNGLGTPNVCIPTSNPLVLGCGGTAPVLGINGKIISDSVWNQGNGQIGSGGGYSALYPVPGYQSVAVGQYPFFRGATRGVPDVAANASAENGYKVIFNGVETAIGGTSASTPLWAGLIARLNEALEYRLGCLNPVLYQLAGSDAFQAIVNGNNGYFPAAPYWNPATGLGSPNGEKLLARLRTLQ